MRPAEGARAALGSAVVLCLLFCVRELAAQAAPGTELTSSHAAPQPPRGEGTDTPCALPSEASTEGQAQDSAKAREKQVPEKQAEQAELYRQFECRFRRGEYAAALPFLERACSRKMLPACLLNLGTVHHALWHCEIARSYYFRYLDVAPYGEASTAARSALNELAANCDPAPSSAATVPQAATVLQDPPGAGEGPEAIILEVRPLHPAIPGGSSATPARADERSRVWTRELSPWLLGVGAASGVATIVALVHSRYANDDAESRDRQNGRLGLSNDPELRAIDRSGRRSNQLATVFGVTSGLLLAGGATLQLLALGETSVSVAAAGPAQLSVEGSF